MNDTSEYATPIIDSILHPTDFTEGSRVAFYHALRAALLAQSKLRAPAHDARNRPGMGGLPWRA